MGNYYLTVTLDELRPMGAAPSNEPVRLPVFRDVFEAMMTKLTDVTIDYLRMQAEAGANALMIFGKMLWASMVIASIWHRSRQVSQDRGL